MVVIQLNYYKNYRFNIFLNTILKFIFNKNLILLFSYSIYSYNNFIKILIC